jgi:O-antigen ligase/tetratricopeptide (TPR) repeat protein
MSAKTYQRILQFGLFLSLGVIFLLFSGLLFPYITSKQFTFNIIMQLLFPFWLLLVLKFPSFGPPRSLITWGIVAFLFFILISAFTGVDFNLSFWGDIERLLGFFHILHFFFFYLYLITAFRTRQDWYLLLSASVLTAVVQAFLVLFLDKIGTIGNTAYVSGYFIFNLYFALILIVRTHWIKQWPFYLAIIVMLIAFLKANTSGAIIGLSASLLFLLVLLGLFANRQRVRRVSLAVCIVSLAGIALLFSQYNQPWFKENRVLSNLSAHKGTFQTRRLSWEGAFKDLHRHPWLGTGFGNYTITFDRQFNPEFLDYSPRETYFDRAHNNLIDILSTTGVLGLVAYLSIFVFAVLAWFRGLKQESWRIKSGLAGGKMRELILLAALIVAYFVQNLAVFDSLATYMGLMLSLAYLVFLVEDQEPELDMQEEVSFSGTKEISIFIITLIFVLIIMSNFSIRPLTMATKVISGYKQVLTGQVAEGFDLYKEAFSYNTPFDRDGRSTLVNIVIQNPTILTRLPAPQIESSLIYVIELAERNLSYNPQDSLMQMQMAQLYDIASRYYYQNPDVFKQYSDQALAAAEKSLAASPQRVPVYYILAQIQANRGDLEKAEQSFLAAYNLNPRHVDSHCQLANYYFLVKDERYRGYSDYCLNGGNNDLVTELFKVLVLEYEEEDNDKLLLLSYRALVERDNKNPLLYIGLAKAELAVANFEAAIEAAILAADLDPELRPIVTQFLIELRVMRGNQN